MAERRSTISLMMHQAPPSEGKGRLYSFAWIPARNRRTRELENEEHAFAVVSDASPDQVLQLGKGEYEKTGKHELGNGFVLHAYRGIIKTRLKNSYFIADRHQHAAQLIHARELQGFGIERSKLVKALKKMLKKKT